MGNWLDQNHNQIALEKISHYIYKEAVLSLSVYHHVFHNYYNNIEIPETDEITKENFQEADEYFKFIFEQEMEAERFALKPGEQFFFDKEPEVMSALTFFKDFICREDDLPLEDKPIFLQFLAGKQKRLSVLFQNFNRICDVLSKWLPPETDYLCELLYLKGTIDQEEGILRTELEYVPNYKKGLQKGRLSPKRLKALDMLIESILKKHGLDTKLAVLFKKIMVYRDDSPFYYGDLELKYDAEAKKIYQVNQKTGKEKSVGIKKVYEYSARVRERIKKAVCANFAHTAFLINSPESGKE